MSIWGKIIGGAAGFALAGPIGALVGGLAGHVADRYSGTTATTAEPEAGTRQVAFTIAVIVLGAKMAKADGTVTRDEVAAFRQVFQVPPEEMKNVGRVFDMARRDADGFEPYARQVARLFENEPQVLEDLLNGLYHIAKADDVLHPSELEFLRQVAEIFGIDQRRFDAIHAMHTVAAKDDPYTILGIAADADDTSVKQAYRRLVREHHPDNAIAQGLPQEFVDLANARLAAINEAYDEVSRRRGLT